jgi:hypothetical protein
MEAGMARTPIATLKIPRAPAERPAIRFNLFEQAGTPGAFEAVRATGTFPLKGKEIELTVPVPEQRPGESGADAYRRVLVEVRDALSDMINNPHGVRL